jgi:iron complex outermembrane receptor protein
LITASLRADGSTKLGVNDKYGYFPAVGLGYKLLADKEGLVNQFKIKEQTN